MKALVNGQSPIAGNPSVTEGLMPLRLTEARSGPRLGEAQRLWSIR